MTNEITRGKMTNKEMLFYAGIVAGMTFGTTLLMMTISRKLHED